MKKIWLIALIFNTLFFGFGNTQNFSEQFRLDLFASEKLDFEKGTSGDLSLKNNFTDNLLYGGTLFLPFLKLFYIRKDKNQAFSMQASTQNLLQGIYITALAGNLSFSGALSKLNNPVLSTSSSPFSAAQTGISGITVSSQSTSALSKPFSYVLQFDFTGKKVCSFKKKVSANILYTQKSENFFSFSNNDTLAFSSLLKLSNKKKNTFSFSTALGLFPYDENVSSSWFSKGFLNNYYYHGKHYCQNIQGSFLIKDFSTSLSASVYESPFGNYFWTFQNENKLSPGNLTINFSQFYSPYPVFTSSSKIVKISYQAKTSIQYNLFSILNDKIFLTKTALGFYYSQTDENTIYKISAGIKNSYEKLTSDISGSYDFSTLKIQIKLSINEPKIKSSIYGNFSFKKPEQTDFFSETTEKLGINVVLSKPVNLSCAASISLTQKNGEITKRKVSSSISGKLFYKKININYKITSDFDF